MNFLLHSKRGDGIFLADRLLQEGHEAVVYIDDKNARDVGEGLFPKVDNWQKYVGQHNPIILFDSTGYGPLADKLRSSGLLVIGASEVMDNLELNPAYGKAVMARYDIRTPDGPIDGIKLSTEAWFNGRAFVRPFSSTLKETAFMNGGVGPTVECAGNLTLFYRSDKPKAWTETLSKLERFLTQAKYVGPLTINTIVSEHDGHPYGLDFVARFNYDTFQTQLEGIKLDLGEFLHGIATGTLTEFPTTWDYMLGVRLSVPPYPHGGQAEAVPLTNLPIGHFAPRGVKLNGTGDLTVAGTEGVIGTVTARSGSIPGARRVVYNRIDKVDVPVLQYRTDIGVRAQKDLKRLREWGYL